MLSLEQIRSFQKESIYKIDFPSQKIMDKFPKDKSHTFKTGCERIECLVDRNGHPKVVATAHGISKTHFCIKTLIQSIPELLEEKNLLKLAKAANFLLKGEQYWVITHPEKYKKTYQKDIEAEKEMLELPLNALRRYGVFDVREIQSPRLEKDAFIFYVSQRIPYRVSISLPFDDNSMVNYELLPYAL